MGYALSGKTALVTGANRGIGEAIVNALVAAGVKKVYAAARNISTLDPLVERHGSRVVPLQLDVEILHPRLLGEPLREPFNTQDLVQRLRRAPLLVGDHGQRVVIAAMQPAVGEQLVRVGLGHQTVRNERLQHLGEGEAVVLPHFRCSLHGGEYSHAPRNRQAF